ncbi:hypothetical protein F1559_001474 [Cyanidiococcus yangmingshanensis]|uniref:Uncharacterized protein n=1 Tax=Cyanidiococcus yangmingshanensis TaxID=2690220 RepID=A0A7J7IJT1_9RHOD|nr:hypothetical protein F1559_001474 [Cyanidiococcus yangmingshanensis]
MVRTRQATLLMTISLETVPPISKVEPVVPTSTSLGSSAQHVEETAIETRPMHWNAREQAATGPSLSMNARTISVEAKPQELLHQVASVMADSTEKDGISSPGAHAHRLGDGWYAQLPPGNVLVSTFSSKEESSEPSLRQVEPASTATAEYRLAEGDPSTDDATAEAEALANVLSRLCDGERSDVECFFGLWQTQGHRMGAAAREMNAEIRRPRTESMTVAWEKCSVLASALDALYQNLHSLQLDLSGCVDPCRITVVPESQENDKVVSSREPSRLLNTTQHALVPWPSSVQPTRLHSVRIGHSIADITAEVQLLCDAIQQKKTRARELGRQLASAVDSMQVMSRTLLPQLHREVEHSFALASSTLAEMMEQFKRRAMNSTLQALRPGPETMDAVKRSEMVGPTLHAILVSLRHLQHALQSMRDIVQQQQQEQLSISAPASCRPAVRYPLRHVPCERLLAQTARCRAQLFDWRQHVTEHSCVLEDLFRQLNEALYHLASTKPSAKDVRRAPSPNRDQSGILAMLRGQRRRVYSLRTALVRVRASCIDEFTSWQRLFEEHRNRLVTKAAHAERQQGYAMNPNVHSRPDMEETQPNPLTRSVLSQRTTSALSAEEPRALVVELIETKLALAEQKEVEEHLRREMRRQQRELHQTIAKLGETVSRLEIKLAKSGTDHEVIN